MDANSWWDLHVRKARGETLSAEEEQLYATEIARQDRAAGSPTNATLALKKLRNEVLAAMHANAGLREQFSALEQEICTVEQSLSRETRQSLGMAE